MLSVLLTMTPNHVTNSVAQRLIIKFILNSDVKATEIHQQLQIYVIGKRAFINPLGQFLVDANLFPATHLYYL